MYNILYNKGTKEAAVIATHYSDLRENLKGYMDKVCDDFEPVTITRKGAGRNVVMLSEESYNNILENMYVLGNRENLGWLMESKRQLEAGLAEEHALAGAGDD